MAQVTGKKVATTPMPTPTGTSGAIIDSFNTQDDKTVNAPSIHIVEDALTTINDKLSKHTINENTKITLPYNTVYTTLADGYFLIRVIASGNYYVRGYVDGIQLIRGTFIAGADMGLFNSIFVRKGTNIHYNGNDQTKVDGYFYPLA